MDNAARLDAAIVHSRDNAFDYFGFKTLERSYLLRIEGLIVERPQVLPRTSAVQILPHVPVRSKSLTPNQHLLMRVAVGIHKVRDLPSICALLIQA